MHINLNKTVKFFIASFITIVMLVGVYVFLFISMRNKIEDTAISLEKIENLSAKDARIETNSAVLKAEMEAMEKVSASFIKESQIVEFIKMLENVGKLSNTNLTIESLEPTRSDRNTPTLNFRVKATGQFKDTVQLIALLEDFPARFDWNSTRFVRVDATVAIPTLGEKGIVKKATSTSTQLSQVPQLWSVETSLTAFNFVKE